MMFSHAISPRNVRHKSLDLHRDDAIGDDGDGDLRGLEMPVTERI